MKYEKIPFSVMLIVFALFFTIECSAVNGIERKVVKPFDVLQTDTNDVIQLNEYNCIDPLFEAVAKNDTARIRMLILEGCDPNLKINLGSNYDDSPLRQAVYYCDTGMLRFMLEHGADPNQKLGGNFTPTHYAAGSEKEKFSLLLEYGGNITTFVRSNYSTPLLWAIEQNRIENVKTMLALGVQLDPDTVIRTKSAISTTIYNKRYEMIDLLIEYGFDPNVTHSLDYGDWMCICPEGITAIHALVSMCSRGDNIEQMEQVLLKLIEMGANINFSNIYGHTPLDFAVCGENSDIIDILMMNGAEIRSSLFNAAKYSNFETVEALLAYGANPNKICYGGDTPLMACMDCCGDGFGDGITYEMRVNTIDLLLEAGADPNMKNNKSWSFMESVKAGYQGVFLYFIEKGILEWSDMKISFYGNFDLAKHAKKDGVKVKLQPNRSTKTILLLNENDTVYSKRAETMYFDNTTKENVKWAQIEINNIVGFVIADELNDIYYND